MPTTPRTVADVLEVAGVPARHYGDVMPRVHPERVEVREAPAWLLLFWVRGISAITLPWAVYVHPEVMDRYRRGDGLDRIGRLMVHVLMHVEQLARMGVVRHTLQYVADYLRGRFSGLGHWAAYRSVRLEREARAASVVVGERLR